ncbi:LPXTG cell wall anchor domain-containing protein [Lacticaseibacillus sharpeae]|uniref:LPXTG cell wall anchor domain-containing protein n=1 Tax=Lacticaseibacillus sharpeae TaxID=1626 RepID=UPI0006D1E99B|nr:LPXTG cell wall anchor domain-containing protein [Lacticaseibacillus sharpeae]
MKHWRICITIAVVLLFTGALVKTVVHATDSTAQVEVVGEKRDLPDTGTTPAAGSGNKPDNNEVRYADALPGTKAGTYKRVYVKNTVTTMHHLPQTGNEHNPLVTALGIIMLLLTGTVMIARRKQVQ